MNLKRIFYMYIAALALLFASVSASMILTEMVTRQIAVDSREINVSGRQRMLSQRIIYLSQDLLVSERVDAPETKAQLIDAVEELEAAIELFESSHATLSTSDTLDAARVALYFIRNGEEKPLNERIRNFIQQARNIVENRDVAASLDRLKTIERAGLLTDLDEVVTATEAASLQRLDRLRDLGWYSLVIALLIVLVEVALVFLPGHRMIEATLAKLKVRNEQLGRAHQSLQAKTDALLKKNEQIAMDKLRLEEACRESEALRREQSEFTYAVSHDLKSPANTMHLLMNELQLEHAKVLDDDGKSLLGMALGTVERMELQIEDLLQYCWATDPQSKPEQIDMNDCLQRVLTEMEDEIATCGAKITFDDLPPFFGHRIQITVLMKNLIQNAMKFRAPDTIPKVHIGAQSVGLGEAIKLWVRDNGIGIAPENHARVFGLFQRLHVREAYPGTGLGLTTCHRIARNHAGNITIESQEGHGSCFLVSLCPAVSDGSDVDPPAQSSLKDAA